MRARPLCLLVTPCGWICGSGAWSLAGQSLGLVFSCWQAHVSSPCVGSFGSFLWLNS